MRETEYHIDYVMQRAEKKGTPTCLLCRHMIVGRGGEEALCMEWPQVSGQRMYVPLPHIPIPQVGVYTRRANKCDRYDCML